ncbi:MAG: mannose-6-phosphate isomerase, partial [bacterium]
QVHPDDRLAARRNIGNGKTEMWYILEAGEQAELISGFNREVNQNLYLKYLEEKKLKDILNVEKVQKGDLFFMPAGRIHALGPGILLAEIQQTSDTTYRIYDWDRVGADGKSRELHMSLALEAIDFKVPDSYRTIYRKAENKTVNLVDCPAFTTNLIAFHKSLEKDISYIDSFLIYLCTEGECQLLSGLGKESLRKGEVLVLPAIPEKIILKPNPACTLLEIFLP